MNVAVVPPINASDPPLFDVIASHAGHHIEVALYGNKQIGTVNASLECTDCNAVLIDVDRYESEQGEA